MVLALTFDLQCFFLWQVADIIQEKVPKCRISASQEGQDQDRRDYEVCYKRIHRLGFKSTIKVEQGVDDLLKVLPYMSEGEVARAKNV